MQFHLTISKLVCNAIIVMHFELNMLNLLKDISGYYKEFVFKQIAFPPSAATLAIFITGQWQKK